MELFASPMLAITVLMVFSCTLCNSLDTPVSYEEYCQDISANMREQQHDISPSSISSYSYLGFHRASFVGGSPLYKSNTMLSFRNSAKSAYFAIQNVKQEGKHYVVEASLLLQNRSRLWSGNGLVNVTRVFRQGGVRRDPFLQPGGLRLTFRGLWLPGTGIICMSGCFMQNALSQSAVRDDCRVKALFRYPLSNNISKPLVKGILESKRDRSDPLFFEPIVITGIYEAPYVFRKDAENAPNGEILPAVVAKHINVWKDETAICQFPWYRQPLDVAWNRQCTGLDCSPFRVVGPSTHSTLSVENMVCAEGKVRGFFIFNYGVLAIEGVWNASAGQLSASGCFLDGVTNSSLNYDSRDCDIGITLQFPITLELTFRYSVIGRVERKAGSSLDLFKPFLFTGHMDITYGPIGWGRSPPQLEYAYTPERIEQARNQCQVSRLGKITKKIKTSKRKVKYPDGQIFSDFGFHATLKDSAGSVSEAYFSPVAINKRTNLYFTSSLVVATSVVDSKKKRSLNISFDINLYTLGDNFKLIQNTTFHRLPAEGVYNPKTGLLCLTACRFLALGKDQSISNLQNSDKDCEMHVTVQYPPTNPGFFDNNKISGQVSSSREQKDKLFFSPVTISSGPIFYQEQAAMAIEQIDFEIVMGMISLTMSILFTGLQLRHVRKNPKVLPQMSLLTLLVLTLGHLIPLVLNFEAIFSSRARQNVLQWSGGWLEINEVIVRLMTMVMFLMLVRLLHLSWVSKCESSGSEGPWQVEKAPLCFCLPTYALAGLISVVVYGIKGSNFLDVLKGFAGLMVDFFLFPQVVGNYVWEVQGTVLSFAFYMGMTFVRSLPHVYDIVRRLEFFTIRDRRYYYANPTWDFYSNVWDAVIPCGALLFAILVFCQQRYGGACFSLASWRQRRAYNQISMNPI